MKKFKSCVDWPYMKEHPSIDYTEDYHDTKEQAEHVCDVLERRGFGCSGIYFPINT